MRLLHDRIIRGDGTPHRTIRLGHRLLVRASTVPDADAGTALDPGGAADTAADARP